MTREAYAGWVAGLTLLLFLCGCAASIDPQQAQTCRMAAVAVFDPVELRIVTQAPIAAANGAAPGVSIGLEGRDDGKPHRIDCLFMTSASGADPDLVAVRTEAGALSEPALLILKRFWLDTPDAKSADPSLGDRGKGLPVLPFGAAYALQSLMSALPNVAVYSLLAATYSLLYGLFGRINLAFGEMAAIGGFAALIGATVWNDGAAGGIVLAGCVFAIWAAGIHGAVTERLVMWPLRRSSGQQGLVATIGLALFLQEYLRLANSNQPKWLPSILSGALAIARAEDFIVTVTPLSLLVFGISVAAGVGVLCLLRFTSFGRAWRATSDDPVAAALFGVDPRRLSLHTFVLACGLAGLVGGCVTLISGSVGVAYTTTLGLKALIAAIVGGIGSVPGAFMGGLAIALIEAGWSAYFPIVYRDLVIDTLLVAVLVFRPGGLLGYSDLLPRRI